MKIFKDLLTVICLFSLLLFSVSCESPSEQLQQNKLPEDTSAVYSKTSTPGGLIATLYENDGYDVIRKPKSTEIINPADYISKDENQLYTIEDSKLKRLDKPIEKHSCSTSFKFDGEQFTLTYTWYELDGNYYIDYENIVQNGYSIYMSCTDGKRAVIDIQGEYKEHILICEPDTGKITDPFSAISEQYNISFVNLSSDGKKAFLNCYKGKPNDLYGPIFSSSSTAKFGKTTSFYFYFDGKSITDVAELCGLKPECKGAYGYFIDDKLIVLTSSSSGNDNKDYIYSYNVSTGTVKNIVDGLTNEKDHFTTHERYGSCQKDGKLYIIDYLTEKTAASDITLDDLYDLNYIGDKYVLITYNNGKCVLAESSTGDIAGTANTHIDESGRYGYVFEDSSDNVYLAVCNESKISIYLMG